MTFLITLLILFSNTASAAELLNIRHSVSNGNVKVVFDFDGPIGFISQKEEAELNLKVQNSFSKQDNSYYQVLNGLLGKISLKNTKDDLSIIIPLNKNAGTKIYELLNPNRLVVEIKRKEIGPAAEAEGINYKYFQESRSKGVIKVHALLIDPKIAQIKPVISTPYLKTKGFTIPLLSQIFDFVFGSRKENTGHFRKNTVSSFVQRENAYAGINGTFFFKNGSPVGTLIIDKQIISSPYNNRTSLLFFENGGIKIDNVKIGGYIKLGSGQTFPFSAVNQPITNNEIMLYTPDYQVTDPDINSINIIIIDNKIKSITNGQDKIPANGYILSAANQSKEILANTFRIGDDAKLFFMASPSLDGIEHVISGGPRLVAEGSINITSDKENFKNDVKNSRAARTAAGITKDGNLIFLVVEKNNGSDSIGATLTELANLMIKAGSYNAMNLDGGGSSTMVIKGKAVNTRDERPVCNAIVIKPN